MLNPIKKFTLAWWQIAIYETALIALGIAVGSSWSDFFAKYTFPLVIVFALGAAFMWSVWWKQITSTTEESNSEPEEPR